MSSSVSRVHTHSYTHRRHMFYGVHLSSGTGGETTRQCADADRVRPFWLHFTKWWWWSSAFRSVACGRFGFGALRNAIFYVTTCSAVKDCSFSKRSSESIPPVDRNCSLCVRACVESFVNSRHAHTHKRARSGHPPAFPACTHISSLKHAHSLAHNAYSWWILRLDICLQAKMSRFCFWARAPPQMTKSYIT